MKLKDLTVELSRNDNLANRSVKIGPLSDGLNFIYGENGAGKSTVRRLVSGLLTDSQFGDSPKTYLQNDKIELVVESGSGSYRVGRDELGKLTSTRIGNFTDSQLGAPHAPVESLFRVDRELAECLSFVAFSQHNQSELQKLHSVLHRRFNVPFGVEAATVGQPVPVEQKLELQSRIEARRNDLTQLHTQRASLESNTSTWTGNHRTAEIDRQINELAARLIELEPNRIRQEIESLHQESARLRAEISRVEVTVQATKPSHELVLLYRLLDEIDQQTREIRSVQSNIQRHRIRLKEEMELLGNLTIEEDNHPYHRAVEILRQIENRIDNADTRGDQWLEDHGTVDAQQVSRFLDETCRSLRTDLQTLCDELSSRYKEMHCRSATVELKELRHTYSHLTEVTQHVLARREALLREIHAADAAGAELIRQANPDFCHFAVEAGYFAACQKFLGTRTPVAEVSRDTSLQQQQLSALEARLATLTSTLSLSESESRRITSEISDLNAKKQSLSSVFEAENREKIALLLTQIQSVESEIRSLSIQLDELNSKRSEPHSLLISASGLLGQLTLGEYSKVWLQPTAGEIFVQNRLGQELNVQALEERGLKQLVQLSLILAANEQCHTHDAPLVLDDLFADLRKERVDSSLSTISRWSELHQKQIVVLTQHRFLADRLTGSPSWELELGNRVVSREWTSAPPTVHTTTVSDKAAANNVLLTPSLDSWQEEVHVGAPVAEYPYSPMPRPYPLSKYPRTTDRRRNSSASNVDYFENFVQPQVQIETVSPQHNGFVEVNTSGRTSVISPSAIGDRYEPTTINDSTLVDSIAIFDNAQLRCLEDHEIETVGEFMQLDPQSDSDEFANCYLAGQSLEYLQSSVWHMFWVPNLSVDDAQALVACGISDPEHLLTSNADSLYERLSRFLRSPDGRRFGGEGMSLGRNTVRSWQSSLRNNRDYRRQRRPRPSRAQRSRDHRQPLRAWTPTETDSRGRESLQERTSQRRTVRRDSMPIRNPRMQTPEPKETSTSTAASALAPMEPRRKPPAVRQTSKRQSINGLEGSESVASSQRTRSKTKSKPSAQKLRFYLDLTDHIEAAPSIGPKTATRFEAIGVHTIRDFLKMTAESMAEKLEYKRLNANLIRQYQNQTRLVCRIPNLRGHDAQLLVGCGIVEAEELASMRPDALFAKIAPFSDTKEGLKIIRNGKKPDLAEVTDWISFAQHNRSLQAA